MTRQSSDDVSDKHDDINGCQIIIGRTVMGEMALTAHFMRMILDNTSFKIELKKENSNTMDSEFDQKIINSGGRPLIFHEESYYHKK